MFCFFAPNLGKFELLGSNGGKGLESERSVHWFKQSSGSLWVAAFAGVSDNVVGLMRSYPYSIDDYVASFFNVLILDVIVLIMKEIFKGTINRNNRICLVPVEEFVKGVANMLGHLVRLMIESNQGIIVNLSSGWGRSAAAQGLTWSAAKELHSGMAIVALNPGVINMDMLVSCFGSSMIYTAYTSHELLDKSSNKLLFYIFLLLLFAFSELSMADNGASLTV
ncbi:NADPH-dependent pterin aldehyde reductase [Camellia lanceoleosa]|uniref:NADPH-dependent pterin aldehyde reductase n=1 Tax=Camellia lanceoleosa TaxID=1840588 RepID=A0ACC0H1P2_9ERIC|nr:NADPH-dependent pterin aldehyde reductase [Camellia lanceoleosa]